MHSGFASKTAQSVAIRRAEHQLFDFPHVLDDPIAPRIIGPTAAAAAALFGWMTAYRLAGGRRRERPQGGRSSVAVAQILKCDGRQLPAEGLRSQKES
jgi:hypothetical protein